MSKIIITGYHGTNAANKTSILTAGFTPSSGDSEWLGDGVYFFVKGLTTSDPVENARKWTVAAAYDKKLKKYIYRKYVIFESQIEVEENVFLNLTEPDGMKMFNYLRDRYIQKTVLSKTYSKLVSFKDGHILNEAREELKLSIDLVKGDFYVKFAQERKFRIDFRIPNVTFVAVSDLCKIVSCKIIEEKHF